MFAASVFNFVAPLHTLPEAYAKEVLDISANFMLGPGQWFKGRGNPVPHPYFQARVDIGMKAVPRCIVSQVRTINYMSARQSLLSAGSRVAILENDIGDNLESKKSDMQGAKQATQAMAFNEKWPCLLFHARQPLVPQPRRPETKSWAF